MVVGVGRPPCRELIREVYTSRWGLPTGGRTPNDSKPWHLHPPCLTGRFGTKVFLVSYSVQGDKHSPIGEVHFAALASAGL